MKIISVFNQKGGVGKTITTLSTATALSLLGKKTLIVEEDHQSNIRKLFVKEMLPQSQTTLTDLYRSDIKDIPYSTKDAIINIKPNLDLMLTGPSLAAVETELTVAMGSEQTLKTILSQLNDYDFILIDNPPALGNLTINSLTASDSVLIPIDIGPWALEGVDELLKTFHHVRKKLNKSLGIEGVLLTKAKEGGKSTRKVRIDLSQDFESYFLDDYINECIHFDNAIRSGQTIYDYTTKTGVETLERAKRQYMNVAKYLIKKSQ